jgi:hypothetical protein
MPVMNRRLLTREGRAVLALTFFLALTRTSEATEFFAVVESTGKKPFASLDISLDTRAGVGVNVEFTAYDSDGTFVSQFFVPINPFGFASTESFGNLFELTTGRPMLIRARTPQDQVNSGATLNVRSANGPMTFGVLPLQKIDSSPVGGGRLFSIALGSFRSARLLIANVSGAQISVDVFQGTEHAPGSGIYSNPRLPNFGQWRVDLTQNESLSNLVIQASGWVVVQVVIDDGKVLHSFMAPPMA